MDHTSIISALASDMAQLSTRLLSLAEEIENDNAQNDEKNSVQGKLNKQHNAKQGIEIFEKNSETVLSNKKETTAVTIEQVRAVLAEKSQVGLSNKVKDLLESFGVKKLSAVSEKDYSDLLEAAKKLKG